MSTIWREFVREYRWVLYSPTALLLGASSLVLAVWGATSGSSSVLGAIDNFNATLGRYQENGEDISSALNSPATVEGDAGQQIISNSLRYDLDQVGMALTQLTPTGAACAILSLCVLIAFPILGFALGVFMSTHDIQSGSIAIRWPQAGIRPFLFSKPAVIATSMLAMAIAVALLSAPAALIAGASIQGATSEMSAFAGDPPSLGRVAALVALSALSGTAAASIGLLVGAVTRNRTFTVAIFSVGYLLLPLFGENDPRNFLTLAGRGVLYFPGLFRPEPLGDTSAAIAVVAIVIFCLVVLPLSATPWLVRSRVRRVG